MKAKLVLIECDGQYWWHLNVIYRGKLLCVECYAEGYSSRRSAERAARNLAVKLNLTITGVEEP